MDYSIKEALSVVSEDQSIFDPTYGASHLMKTEMTSPDEYNQTGKESAEQADQDWVTHGSRGHIVKRENDHINGTRPPPITCNAPRRNKVANNAEVSHIAYQPTYTEPRPITPTSTSHTEEKRVIVPADPGVWTHDHVRQWVDWAVKEYGLLDMDSTSFQNIDGKDLCKMTKEDFMRITSPYNTDILLSHLGYLRQRSNADGKLTVTCGVDRRIIYSSCLPVGAQKSCKEDQRKKEDRDRKITVFMRLNRC